MVIDNLKPSGRSNNPNLEILINTDNFPSTANSKNVTTSQTDFNKMYLSPQPKKRPENLENRGNTTYYTHHYKSHSNLLYLNSDLLKKRTVADDYINKSDSHGEFDDQNMKDFLPKSFLIDSKRYDPLKRLSISDVEQLH